MIRNQRCGPLCKLVFRISTIIRKWPVKRERERREKERRERGSERERGEREREREREIIALTNKRGTKQELVCACGV